MLLSIIVCTYKRVESTRTLLYCLEKQTHRAFEVLVVDGSGDQDGARAALEKTIGELQPRMDVRLVRSPKGLTIQRNRGLDFASGEIIAFLDDDVTFDRDFLAKIIHLFEGGDLKDAGGISAYDTRNYGRPFSLRWKVRAKLGVVPPLEPGNIDRLGRSIPLGFAEPFVGCKDVGYLYGFCMIYRREAIGDLRFDETLPTYAGEDRDFSSRVGMRWRLVLCGDLQLEHHCSPQSRDSVVQRTFQAGFGTGRSFGKNATRPLDYLEMLRVLFGEFLIDSAFCLRNPTREAWASPIARAHGFLAGLKSWRKQAVEPRPPAVHPHQTSAR
jgi:glycosyltransferase involved in cell wall biosynthesis